MKRFKNEKYLYLLMGYHLAGLAGTRINVGGPHGRDFDIKRLPERINLLYEYKRPPKREMDERRRVYEVHNIDTPTPIICEHVVDGVNYSQKWDRSYPLQDAINAARGVT